MHAQRLARAIAADIRVYNAKALEAGTDLDAALAEGRALYCQRVEPAFHPLFDSTIAEVLPELANPTHVATAIPRLAAPAVTPVERNNGLRKTLSISLLLLILALLMARWLLSK